MKRIIFLLMLVSVLSKAFGFLREIVLAYFYGASGISDAYLISSTIPTVIFAFLATALATSYIPLYTQIQKERGKEQALRFSNNIINFLLLFCILIAAVCLVFAEPIVRAFASGFAGETLRLAVFFTRISIAAVFFMGLTYILRSYLQIRDDFISPALIGFPYNIILIASVIVSVRINYIFLPLGLVLAIAAQFFFVLPFAWKKGYRYEPVLDRHDENVRKVVYLALPVILGTSVSQINTLVDRTLASGIAVGGISALNYASRLNGFIQDIFVISLSTVMYPFISRMAADNNMEGLKKSLAEAVNAVSLIVVPITAGTMIFAVPIVNFLFARGAFDIKAAELTSSALFFYAAGMLGIAFNEILSKTFYALQDTRTPMANAVIALIANIILNLVLSRFLGIGGLALATSISMLLAAFLMFASLRRKIGPFGVMNILVTFARIVLASAVMGVSAWLVYRVLLAGAGMNKALILAVISGAVVYGVIIYFMRIREAEIIIDTVKARFKGYLS